MWKETLDMFWPFGFSWVKSCAGRGKMLDLYLFKPPFAEAKLSHPATIGAVVVGFGDLRGAINIADMV